MKVPEFERWSTILFLVVFPVARGGWVVATTESARVSLGTGLELFLNLALPPIICGFLLLHALDRGGKRFERLRTNKASLKSMMLAGFVTSIVAGPMFIFLAGAYFGKVLDMFLRPTYEDWGIFAELAAMMSAMFIALFSLGTYAEAKDRKASKR